MPQNASDDEIRFEVVFTAGISAEKAREIMTDSLCTNPYFKALKESTTQKKQANNEKLSTIKDAPLETKKEDMHVLHNASEIEVLMAIQEVCSDTKKKTNGDKNGTTKECKKLIHKISYKETKELLSHASFFLNEIKMWKKTFLFCEQNQRLHLSHTLLHSYLNFDLLLESPELINGALKTAFSEYKRLYCAETVRAYKTYFAEIQMIETGKESLSKKLKALYQLESLPSNMRPHSPVLSSRFAHIMSLLPKTLLTEGEFIHKINAEADTIMFHIGKKSPIALFSTLQKDLQAALEAQLSSVRNAAVQALTVHANASELEKLLGLLQISELDKVVNLLAEDSKSHVAQTLRKLLLQHAPEPPVATKRRNLKL